MLRPIQLMSNEKCGSKSLKSITDSPLLADLFVPSARSTDFVGRNIVLILAPLAIPSEDPHCNLRLRLLARRETGVGRIREA